MASAPVSAQACTSRSTRSEWLRSSSPTTTRRILVSWRITRRGLHQAHDAAQPAHYRLRSQRHAQVLMGIHPVEQRHHGSSRSHQRPYGRRSLIQVVVLDRHHHIVNRARLPRVVGRLGRTDDEIAVDAPDLQAVRPDGAQVLAASDEGRPRVQPGPTGHRSSRPHRRFRKPPPACACLNPGPWPGCRTWPAASAHSAFHAPQPRLARLRPPRSESRGGAAAIEHQSVPVDETGRRRGQPGDRLAVFLHRAHPFERQPLQHLGQLLLDGGAGWPWPGRSSTAPPGRSRSRPG